MRIAMGMGILAAAVLGPHAVAQTAADPQLTRAPILSATITPDSTVTVGRVHSRHDSGMADFYPVEGAGFHLSAGLTFFERRSMMRRNLKTMRDLVYLPYSVGNSGVHWGYRRVPSFAAGYSQPLDKDVTLGIEVGAMLGRAINRGRRPGVRIGDGRRDAGANEIVHLVLDVSF